MKINKNMKNFIQTTKKTINILLVNFTLAKFTGALVTILLVTLIKYMISGNLHIDYSEFGNNVLIGILGWTINTAVIGWLSDYLGLKGINFNLNQFLYGYDKMGGGDSSSSDFKVKLYNAMESNDGQDSSQHIDKGKGINTGNTKGNGSCGDKFPDNKDELRDEVYHWQIQTIPVKDTLNNLYKTKHLWTEDDKTNVAELEAGLKELSRNISTSIKDLQAKGITTASTLGKHSSPSLTENDTKKPFKKD